MGDIRGDFVVVLQVASLLDRIECLSVFFPINIHTALKKHHMAICITQARRKEIANMSKHQKQKAYFTEYRGNSLQPQAYAPFSQLLPVLTCVCFIDTLLVIALKDLTASTRRLRTALWCALEMALPKPVERQDHHVNKEATGTARCPSPFEGYSFNL